MEVELPIMPTLLLPYHDDFRESFSAMCHPSSLVDAEGGYAPVRYAVLKHGLLQILKTLLADVQERHGILGEFIHQQLLALKDIFE
jgi:hypothetical protein